MTLQPAHLPHLLRAAAADVFDQAIFDRGRINIVPPVPLRPRLGKALRTGPARLTRSIAV